MCGNRCQVVHISEGYQDPHFVEAKTSFVIKLHSADLLEFPLLLALVAAGCGGAIPGSNGGPAAVGAPGGIKEMTRSKRHGFCCGAGGGRMWFEEAPSQRVSVLRSQEAIATGARTLATACPFCLNMMTDGMAGTQGGENVKGLDIAELLLRRPTGDQPKKSNNRETFRDSPPEPLIG